MNSAKVINNTKFIFERDMYLKTPLIRIRLLTIGGGS